MAYKDVKLFGALDFVERAARPLDKNLMIDKYPKAFQFSETLDPLGKSLHIKVESAAGEVNQHKVIVNTSSLVYFSAGRNERVKNEGSSRATRQGLLCLATPTLRDCCSVVFFCCRGYIV